MGAWGNGGAGGKRTTLVESRGVARGSTRMGLGGNGQDFLKMEKSPILARLVELDLITLGWWN